MTVIMILFAQLVSMVCAFWAGFQFVVIANKIGSWEMFLKVVIMACAIGSWVAGVTMFLHIIGVVG